MGCCHSAEVVSAGVGRRNAILLGRRNAGKARVLAALGKSKWEPTTATSKGDKQSHVYSGITIEKLSTNSVPGTYWEDWVSARVSDIGADKLMIWYLFDDGAQADIADAAKDIMRICSMKQLAGIPIWVIINTKNPRSYERFKEGKLRLQGMLDALQLENEDISSYRGRVKRVIRITLKERGYRTMAGPADSAGRMDQLLDAIKGGTVTSTG